jgi:hypothetical protein
MTLDPYWTNIQIIEETDWKILRLKLLIPLKLLIH